MSEEKPPSRTFFNRLADKFFPKTLKPREQLMQALKQAEAVSYTHLRAHET